MVMTKFKYLFF